MTANSHAAQVGSVVATGSRSLSVDVHHMLDTFVYSSTSDYIFSDNISHLKRLLSSHNVTGFGLDVAGCQQALLGHILNGACARNQYHGCSRLRASFRSQSHLAVEVLDIVCRDDLSDFFTEHVLGVICDNLGVGHREACADRPVLVAYLKRHRDRLYYTSCQSIGSVFDSFDALPRPSLFAMAEAHGIDFRADCTLEDLRTSITAHISGGFCSCPHPLPVSMFRWYVFLAM